MQKNNAFNKYYFCRAFFRIASYQILQNDDDIFLEKESSQLYCSQFLEINSLLSETIKNQFSKIKFL